MKLGPTEAGAAARVPGGRARATATRRAACASTPPRRSRSPATRCTWPRARARSFDEVVPRPDAAVSPDDLLDGVAPLIAEIRVEVLLEEGTRLIVLRDLGATDATTGDGPGRHRGRRRHRSP